MYDRQDKTQASDPISESTISGHKTASSAADPTRQPVWTQAMGDQPPAGLVSHETGSITIPQARLTINQLGESHEQMTMGHSGSGRPLPAEVRNDAERQLGQPLDHVRLHDDTEGGWTALSLGARAVTSGDQIFVAPGQLDTNDRSLLIHELAHVVSQDASLGKQTGLVDQTHPAERFAQQIAAGHRPTMEHVPVGVYRDPMSQANFERQMRSFGVARIINGTFDQQVQRLNYLGAGARPGDRLQRSSWTAWNPGRDASVYDWIIAAFSAFARQLGGIPAVQEVIFFETDYNTSGAGPLTPKIDTLAEYSAGSMAIYHSALIYGTGLVFPLGRGSVATGSPTRPSTPQEEVLKTITHEMGHGYVETALTPPPATGPAPMATFMRDYRRAVGWTASDPAALYDIGVPGVGTDLTSGRTPNARYRINRTNWNDPRWLEQPVSAYSTTHPSEDLPEAIAFYINMPGILRLRSPQRFAFIDSHKAALAPYLRHIPVAPHP